jgi:hypothetical protein
MASLHFDLLTSSHATLYSRLEELFQQSTTTFSRLIVILIGMGGVGKTPLALEYCLRMKGSGNFRGIVWLDASSRNSLYRAMEIITKLLSPGRVFDDINDPVASVKDILSKWNDRWLMVIDNFDDPSDLQDIPNFFRRAILVPRSSVMLLKWTTWKRARNSSSFNLHQNPRNFQPQKIF